MPAQKKPAVHDPSKSEAADDKSEHSNVTAAEESLAIVEPSAPAVLPPMFSVGGRTRKVFQQQTATTVAINAVASQSRL